MNQLHDDDQYEWITNTDGRRVRILRDGGVVRVPLTLMDSMQRSVYAAVRDGTFGDQLEKLRQQRDAIFEQRQIEDENAWRGDANKKICPSCGFDLSQDYMTRAGGNGDETDDAARNPHNKHFDLDAARAVRAQLYQDVADEQANAWRKGKA